MTVGRVFLIVLMVTCKTSGSSSSAASASAAASSSSSSSAAGSAEVIDANGCPQTWTLVGQKCLTAVMTSQSWQDALETCVDKGGALFFPESAESMNFVRGSMTSPCTGFWLGCIDRDPANGEFECPNQDGIYWRSNTDFFGHWNWSSDPDPSIRGSDEYCTLTIGASYWIEGICTYPGVCPACARDRQVPTSIAPTTIPIDSQSRQRNTVYKSFDRGLGCLESRYVIVIFTAPTRIRCAAMCLAHQECRSFNFYPWRKNNCHLSSVSIGSVPADGVTYDPACTYYE